MLRYNFDFWRRWNAITLTSTSTATSQILPTFTWESDVLNKIESFLPELYKPCTCKHPFQWPVHERKAIRDNATELRQITLHNISTLPQDVFTKRHGKYNISCKTYMQLLGFVYTELIIADVEGIPDFEEFIHVTTGSHVAFLVEMMLVPRAAVN